MFLNRYNNARRKEEFFTKFENKEDLTDQSQLCSASISSMAKKFGIDALISKANKMNIENKELLDKLYGNDFSKMFKSKEELLNVKNKINTIFEKLPAKMRKEVFKDNPIEFINAYTTNDEIKLTQLHGLGIIDDFQLNSIKSINEEKRRIASENSIRERFISELEKQKGALYENYKQTGNINFNNNENSAINNPNVQTNLQ